MTGRCRTAMERDGGTLYHAVKVDDDGHYSRYQSAICGAKPGFNGNGWSSHHGEKVTCPRCNKRLEKGFPMAICPKHSALEAERDHWKARAEKAEKALEVRGDKR